MNSVVVHVVVVAVAVGLVYHNLAAVTCLPSYLVDQETAFSVDLVDKH